MPANSRWDLIRGLKGYKYMRTFEDRLISRTLEIRTSGIKYAQGGAS